MSVDKNTFIADSSCGSPARRTRQSSPRRSVPRSSIGAALLAASPRISEGRSGPPLAALGQRVGGLAGGVEGVQGGGGLFVEVEVEDGEVLVDALPMGRLGDDRQSLLDCPPDQDLSRRTSGGRRDSLDY